MRQEGFLIRTTVCQTGDAYSRVGKCLSNTSVQSLSQKLLMTEKVLAEHMCLLLGFLDEVLNKSIQRQILRYPKTTVDNATPSTRVYYGVHL